MKHWSKCATRAGITLVERDYNFGWNHPDEPGPGHNTGPVIFPSKEDYLFNSFWADVDEGVDKLKKVDAEKKAAEAVKKAK